MSKSLTIIWQYLRAFVLIYACLHAEFYRRAAACHYPRQHHRLCTDPLFVLLALQIMPPQWVQPRL